VLDSCESDINSSSQYFRPKTSGSSSTHAYRLYIIKDPLRFAAISEALYSSTPSEESRILKNIFYLSECRLIRVAQQLYVAHNTSAHPTLSDRLRLNQRSLVFSHAFRRKTAF
jgi:hypothetical protein